MTVTEETATESVDALLRATEEVERRLEAGGVEAAHFWLFSLRELLYDLRRLNLLTAGLVNEGDLDRVPVLLQNLAKMVLYEIVPHAQHHMGELVEQLTLVLPEDDAGDED